MEGRNCNYNVKPLALGALLALSSCHHGCHAFVPRSVIISTSRNTKRSMTTLNMTTPPTLIIGPMIRKMRENQAKKNMPMATDDEKAGEAPGLRVGVEAWKWPPVWPYEEDFFFRQGDKTKQAPADNPMAAMMLNGGLGGANQMPPPSDLPDAEERMDSLVFWGVENADVTTDLDETAAEKVRSHYAYYLKDGMSVLELGAAEESYLPTNLNLGRHVGVGACKTMMERNPSLTESYVVDLNKVVPELGVDSEDLRALGTNTFDAIIMANTIDFLTDPREVFKSAWKLLKPGGIMMVPFAEKDAYSSKFGEAQTKMWTNYNDDQHMWVSGSFFQFSAGEGWENLKGFDISPEGAQKDDIPILGGILNKDKPVKMYVVQARKAFASDTVDESDPEASFRSLMWMSPTLEDRDKKLVAPRLARAYMLSPSSETKQRVKENVETLPRVYEQLVKMDQFAFPFNLQAALAADLAGDPGFVGNTEQLEALRMGLGLAKPSESFWGPVGQATAGMDPEDKVNLLAYLVPRFGSGNPAQEEALDSFVSGLKPTFAVVRSKCPGMSEADVQLVGSELLAAEVLIPGRSTREEYAAWLGALTEAEIEEFLAKRKSFKEVAKAELQLMRDRRKVEQERREEERKKYEEQMKKAREERTMVFNPETGKMEPAKK